MSGLKHSVFSEEHLAADWFGAEQNNGILVVTFTERTNRRLDIPGFGVEYLLKRGFDVLAVKSSRDFWYEDLSARHIDLMLSALAQVGREYNYRAGYGSSMGGYAAAKFARQLVLDRVLAISPVFDVKGEWDTRWREDVVNLNTEPMFTGSDVSDSTTYLFIHDPKNQDRVHIERFKVLIPEAQLKVLKVPYSGHPSGYFLNQIGALDHVVSSALLHGVFPSDFRRFAPNRSQSDIYFFYLADECRRRKRLNLAQSLVQSALRISHNNPEYHMLFARILEGKGNLDGAIAACSRASVLNPANPHFGLYRDAIVRRQLRLPA